MHKKKWANIACLITAMVWGGGFIATASALDTFEPGTILALRFSGSAFLFLMLVLIRKPKISKEGIKASVLSGIFLYLAFLLQTIGLKYTSTGMNAFLTAVNVVVVPYLSWIVFRKKPLDRQFLASGLCLFGIGCLSLSSGSFSFNIGDLLSLGCAFLFAGQIMATEKAAAVLDPFLINAIQMGVAAVLSLPYALFIESWPVSISTGAWMSIGYSICIATTLAYMLQTWAQKYTDASSASVLLCTESLFANLFGFLIFHEQKTWIMLFGGAMIFLSVLIVEGVFEKKEKTNIDWI
ncbi:hypothetical protein C815_01112 [Firmicutes bacterium M10-2]|nr:hypothetical protein C815_01112 [Firmicutes bacterium M10-2]